MDHVINEYLYRAAKSGDWQRVLSYKWALSCRLDDEDTLDQFNQIKADTYYETHTSNTTKTA